MLVRRISVLAQKLNKFMCIQDKSFSFVQARMYGVDHEIKQYLQREKEADVNRSTLGDDPKKPKTFIWFPTEAPTGEEFFLGNLRNWFNYKKRKIDKESQKFIPERHEVLGANLATAHFIAHRGGKIRFKNSDFWVELNKDGTLNLPNVYDPHYIVEAVDVNGFDLHYEGLSNLCDLTKLKWLSLKNCKNIDDWGLDKISAEFPELEYLDISGCEKITERGLESLYRMFNLNKLIVTNHNKSATFELTCMMLEDCMPGLTCEIYESLKLPKE
ncbi:distal membrane-arm assembly complex protein 2 [Harpegnathos saltator]|uniref:ATP synthase subunit s-like protein n=1 Tax=Harpegnathos saltator TaxID=610380 RepID=E2BTZ1_HARSA|nr:distal membrane-arm assembly complex protein 2 [Harpegnathos saltator]EFN80890.1 ATP synthase subunit s-like protein [Harpegnathos saltator]